MAVAAVKGAVLGGVLTVVVVTGMQAAVSSAQHADSSEVSSEQAVVDQAVIDHQCSYTGLANDAIPASALIRTTQGELRQVTFAVGWDVYNGKRPGTLVAVCLDETSGNELIRVSS
jgi:hypothetical protein